MKLTIINVGEEKVIPSGKKLREVEINKEGLNGNFHRVAVWEDHPAYPHLTPGLELTKSYIHEKDQDKINPNTGKPYKNYTLYEGEQAKQTPKNNLEPKIDALYALVKQIHENIVGNKTHNETAYEEATGKPYPVSDEELADPSNIPF